MEGRLIEPDPVAEKEPPGEMEMMEADRGPRSKDLGEGVQPALLSRPASGHRFQLLVSHVGAEAESRIDS